MTKQIQLDISPDLIDETFLAFFTENIQQYPGNTTIKFNIIDDLLNRKFTLSTFDKGVLVNDDMIDFLNKNTHIAVSVSTS